MEDKIDKSFWDLMPCPAKLNKDNDGLLCPSCEEKIAQAKKEICEELEKLPFILDTLSEKWINISSIRQAFGVKG